MPRLILNHIARIDFFNRLSSWSHLIGHSSITNFLRITCISIDIFKISDILSGGNVQTRKPGPYGYPSPNFKCEYAKETLYVTKTDWSFDKKCFTVYRTKCRQEYESGKGIGFQKECSEFTGKFLSEALTHNMTTNYSLNYHFSR